MSDAQLPPPGTYRAQRSSVGAAMLGATAFSDSWKVVDSAGETCLSFQYHMHLTSQEWAVTDAHGNAVAKMTRPAGHIHWTYEIDLSAGGHVTFSKQSFAFTHETWRLQGTSSGDVDLNGDTTDHNFQFVDSSHNVLATVSRPWVSVSEAIDVEVSGLDPVIALCAVVALDATEHTKK